MTPCPTDVAAAWRALAALPGDWEAAKTALRNVNVPNVRRMAWGVVAVPLGSAEAYAGDPKSADYIEEAKTKFNQVLDSHGIARPS